MTGLRTVIYRVGDLTKAKAWYTAAFHAEPYFDQPFYVGFNIGGYELGLLPHEKSMSESADNILAYWGVDDIQAAFDELISLGAMVHEKPNNVGGEIMVGSVRDPWGNVIGIIYNPEFTLPD